MSKRGKPQKNGKSSRGSNNKKAAAPVLDPTGTFALSQSVRALKPLRVNGALVVNFGEYGIVKDFTGGPDKPRISIAWCVRC